MGSPASTDKPFQIPRALVWEAYQKVAANKGAPGVDECSVEEFEKDLKNNLYRVWNRMSSGSYFPPPVRAVEIPKSHGAGTRMLGVPTVADRIAQTVVALTLEPRMECIFHPDSYGYRVGRSALDAVAACRQRCWQWDWVVDLDIQNFFGSCPHDLIVKAVAAKSAEVRSWRIHRRTGQTLADLADAINPMVRGWMNYWGRFNRLEMFPLLKRINAYLVRWARKKYKRLRAFKSAMAWWQAVTQRCRTLFVHWAWTRNFWMTG